MGLKGSRALGLQGGEGFVLVVCAVSVFKKGVFRSFAIGGRSYSQLPWQCDHKDDEMHDDRVGFLNAVPRKNILQAAMGITEEYQERAGSKVLSIDPLSKTGHPGNPRPSFKRCWVEDLPAIVQLSFATCRRQIEGTCIGNQVLDAIRSSQCESRIAWPADVLLTMEETAVRPHCCLLCFGVFSVRDGPRLFRGSGGLNTWSVCSKQGCSQHMQLRLGYTHHPKYTRPQPFQVP